MKRAEKIHRVFLEFDYSRKGKISSDFADMSRVEKFLTWVYSGSDGKSAHPTNQRLAFYLDFLRTTSDLTPW